MRVNLKITNGKQRISIAGQLLALAVGGIGGAQATIAAEHAPQAGGEAAAARASKIGAEFRTEFNRNDHGLRKFDNATSPDATTTLELQTLLLKLDHTENKETSFHFRFNLLNPSPSNVLQGPTDYAFAEHWFNHTLGFTVGKEQVLQGGWDNIDSGYRDHWTGAYADNLAFYQYDYALTFHAKVAGEIKVQLLNDTVTNATTAAGKADAQRTGEWNKAEHPTFAAAWLGDFGVVSPIVDVGFYDNQKSYWADVGVKGKFAGLCARLDLRTESKAHKWTDSAGKATAKADTGMAYTTKIAYAVQKIATPWIYYSSYQQTKNKDVLGKTDDKVNSGWTKSASGEASPVWDDNKQVFGLGVNGDFLGHGLTPYLAYLSTSGKFFDPNSTKNETKSEGQLRLGVLGEF